MQEGPMFRGAGRSQLRPKRTRPGVECRQEVHDPGRRALLGGAVA